MAEARREGELGSSVEDVWKVLSDFGGFIETVFGMPVELEGEGIGQTRTIRIGADAMVERLESIDHDAKSVQYSIVSGPMPVANYLSTMRLSAAGDARTKVEWSSSFEPAGGLSDGDAAKIIGGVYDSGIAAMQARFGS